MVIIIIIIIFLSFFLSPFYPVSSCSFPPLSCAYRLARVAHVAFNVAHRKPVHLLDRAGLAHVLVVAQATGVQAIAARSPQLAPPSVVRTSLLWVCHRTDPCGGRGWPAGILVILVIVFRITVFVVHVHAIIAIAIAIAIGIFMFADSHVFSIIVDAAIITASLRRRRL